jgi:hypothetical protein
MKAFQIDKDGATVSPLNSVMKSVTVSTDANVAIDVKSKKQIENKKDRECDFKNTTKKRRKMSIIKVAMVEMENKHPKKLYLLKAANSVYNLVMFYLDIITDVDLMYTFYKNGHVWWASIMLGLVSFPYAIAMLGVMFFIRSAHPWGPMVTYSKTFRRREPLLIRTKWFACLYKKGNEETWATNGYTIYNNVSKLRFLYYPIIMVVSIVSPFFLDLILPLFRLFKSKMTDETLDFLYQYEATRTFCESFLEAFPQVILQVYVYVRCQDGSCGMELESSNALYRSVIISSANLLYHFVMMVLEMKAESMNVCE